MQEPGGDLGRGRVGFGRLQRRLAILALGPRVGPLGQQQFQYRDAAGEGGRMQRAGPVAVLAIDKMRPSKEPVPVILVGGGAILISRQLETALQLIQPEYAEVANAIGAAIAQVGGEVEYIVSYSEIQRETALKKITEEAELKAISAGADESTLRVLDVEETTMSYMDDDAARLRIKVVGDLKLV